MGCTSDDIVGGGLRRAQERDLTAAVRLLDFIPNHVLLVVEVNGVQALVRRLPSLD
jgi:hypothetical protein